MKTIKRRCFVFRAFTGFIILAGAVLLIFGKAVSETQTQVLLAVIIIAGGIAAGLWVRELGKLKIARLIAENPILHIRTAVISDLASEGAQPEERESIGATVSYFGILLDTKIIKFNQDSIRLKAVEIGEDFISFTYDKEKWMWNIRLLRPAIDPASMEKICERFRFETGITPTLLV
ncbi:MAG: hypothetical protein ACOX0U_10765 [Oscillospiraceae bacterium]